MRPLAAIAVAAGLAAATIGIATANTASTAAAPQITGAGVGGVKLGARYEKLYAKGLIGKIRSGCELGGPNTRSAPLRPPLRGDVDFTLKEPRRVRTITLQKGAAARGVGIGATIAEIQAVFPTARVDHSTDEIFLLTLVRVPKSGGGKIHFGVDTKTMRTTVIGVPSIGFCE